MENVIYLWNMVKFLTKFDEKDVNQLRTYYVQCCRKQGNNVELPKQCFGPSNICSYCGSLWTKVERRNRLAPGKACSNSVKKIIRAAEKNARLSRYRLTLMRKCLRSEMNKMVIKCFACLKNTQITCKKPQRQKPKRQEALNDSEVLKSDKKRKRRIKDRTAGLNISLSDSYVAPSSETGSPRILNKSSPLPCKGKKETGKQLTPLQKLKTMNKDKLNSILKGDAVKKRNSLNNFLKELY
ncbi:uncharacterized protein LOC117182185 [Belonocnema kinseyi]|uniref:uncharacterized protein LOC117182185 n=1 Tax=Belonocnema kinseyi TaxID=2817044 RepID=UPI00143DD78F|nr:uncharacterized protein LOC117182185 [Belonocnema kinseyi]